MGEVSVIWLLATMEALLQAKGSKEFVKSSRVCSKAFIAGAVRMNMDNFWLMWIIEVAVGVALWSYRRQRL